MVRRRGSRVAAFEGRSARGQLLHPLPQPRAPSYINDLYPRVIPGALWGNAVFRGKKVKKIKGLGFLF